MTLYPPIEVFVPLCLLLIDSQEPGNKAVVNAQQPKRKSETVEHTNKLCSEIKKKNLWNLWENRPIWKLFHIKWDMVDSSNTVSHLSYVAFRFLVCIICGGVSVGADYKLQEWRVCFEEGERVIAHMQHKRQREFLSVEEHSKGTGRWGAEWWRSNKTCIFGDAVIKSSISYANFKNSFEQPSIPKIVKQLLDLGNLTC